MARTSQVLTDRPSRPAMPSSSIFRPSGRRSVIRAVPPSSPPERLGRLGAGRGCVGHQHQLGIAAGDAHLDVPVVGRPAELERRLGQQVEHAHPQRRLERQAQLAGGRSRPLVSERGGRLQVVLQALDERVQLHDVSMTSLRRHGNSSCIRGNLSVRSGRYGGSCDR